MGRFSNLETNPTGAPGGNGDGEAGPPEPSVGGRALPDGFGRPRARLKLGRQAREESGAAGGLEPDYGVDHYLKEAEKHFLRGDFQAALRMHSRGCRRDAARIEPWVGQVLCLVALGQAKEAMTWAKRGVDLFPEEPRLVSAQALAYSAAGMQERALACSDYALSKSTASADDPFVWLARGSILSSAGNRQADSCFDQAMRARKGLDDWQTPATIATLMMEQRKWTRAAEFLEAAVTAGTREARLHERLGWVYEKLGQSGRAAKAYNAALELVPDDRDAIAGIERLSGEGLWSRLWRRVTGGGRG